MCGGTPLVHPVILPSVSILPPCGQPKVNGGSLVEHIFRRLDDVFDPFVHCVQPSIGYDHRYLD